MEKWEYDVVLLSPDNSESAHREYLNARGAEGWELCALGARRDLSWRAVMKRRVRPMPQRSTGLEET